MQTIFCNNCGNRGHAFRECKKAVLSCGIILLRNKLHPNKPVKLPIEAQNIEMLMIRRKDSMSYTEFMRGKYEPNDTVYVERLLHNMTQHELEQLASQTFETLWARMWNFSERHDQELETSKTKYQAVYPTLLKTVSSYVEPEWGFPKGRRFRCESDIMCAEREFNEETNIPRSAYIVLKDVSFKETFYGTNGIPYEHKYFVALMVRPNQFHIHQKFTSMQKREISAIGWKSIKECSILTRPHYTGRSELLSDLTKFITTIEAWIPSLDNIPEQDNGNLCNHVGS
uniref:CCHC-type domain-containing protein n=1 Tax=viral metagenome TaxID=1070528 RepID=A0A6C0I6B6_9ZZZZ